MQGTTPEKRTETLVFGIPQNGLDQKQREVPLDEPPPLPANAELKYIGKPTQRYDGPAKATGKGRYTADVHLSGMLYARMVGSTIPHGRIVSIDSSEAEKLPGVRAVHVIEHVYGGAELRDPKQEILSRYPIVRYVGQPIAGIAATSQQIADDAAKLVKVKYEPRPFVVDRTDARADDAPVVFPGPADAAGSAGGGGGRRMFRRKAMCTDRTGRQEAISIKVSLMLMRWWKPNTLPRCKRIPRWKRTALSWTGSRMR